MIEVEIFLDDEILLKLALLAHEADIKLNDFIIQKLMEYVDENSLVDDSSNSSS
jgi:predicted HicB family RNase H-like nuclease